MKVNKQEIVQGVMVQLDPLEVEVPENVLRQNIDQGKLLQLAESIKDNGLLQPGVVRKTETGYEIVAGYRRTLALRMLNIKSAPYFVEGGDRKKTDAYTIAENYDRENINPVDEALFILDRMKKYNLNEGQVAKQLKRSVGYVSDRLKILNYPEELIRLIHEDKMKRRIADIFSKIEDATVLHMYCSQAVENGVSESVAKYWVEQYQRDKAMRRPESEMIESTKALFEAVAAEPPQRPQCEMCEEPREWNEIRWKKVCVHCLRVFTEAIKAME